MAEDKKRKINLNLPTYPSNAEAERSVLSALMLDRKVAVELLHQLSIEDFFEPQHKVILEAMQTLEREGGEPDFVNVYEKLERNGLTEKAGGLDYLTDLSHYVPSGTLARQHMEILKKLTLMRSLLEASKAIAEDVYTAEDADRCLENAQARILDITKARTGNSLVHLGEVAREVVRDYEEKASSEVRVTGLLTGYSNLDNAMNGLQRSDVVILAARPSVGKTAFALSIANNIARREPDKKILIFSLEMGSAQLAERMLCNVGQVDYGKMRQVDLQAGDFVRFHKAMNVLSGSQIYLDQTAETNPEQIFSKCKQFSLEHNGVDLIIVDYLQLMDAGMGRNDNRQNEVSRISRRMKLLAKQLNVPIILLSQLSRGVEQRGDKPQLHDLRDSGSIEQDADIVMFLHREKGQPADDTVLELIVAKYRAGQLCSHAFKWEGSTFSFIPVDPNVLYHLKKAGEEVEEAPAAKPKVATVSESTMPSDSDAPVDRSTVGAPVSGGINPDAFSADFFDNPKGGPQ